MGREGKSQYQTCRGYATCGFEGNLHGSERLICSRLKEIRSGQIIPSIIPFIIRMIIPCEILSSTASFTE